MLKRFKKPLVYLLMTMLVMPGYLLSSLISAPLAHASATSTSQGPQVSASLSDDSSFGTFVWTNPANAQLSDNSYALADLDGNSASHYLKLTAFSFSIPSDATIDGITASIERSKECTVTPGCATNVKDEHVKLVKAGVVQSTDRKNPGNWTDADSTVAYGSASDLWGTSWTPADINDADFGIVLSAKRSGGGGAEMNAKVDQITITVNYTTPDTTAPTIPALSSPANNAYVNSSPLNLSWAASTDPDDATPTYKLRVDGGASIPVAATNYNLDISGYADGSAHTWDVSATDGVNVSDWSTARTFTKDVTAPVIDSITGNIGTTGEDTVVTVAAHDAIMLDKAQISVNGGAYADMAGLASPYSYDVSVPGDSTASINYTIKALDKAGNTTTSAVQTITVTDNDAPVINSVSSAPDTTGEVSTVTIDASDNIGIASALININGAGYLPLLGSEPNYSYVYTLPSDSLTSVTYTLKFIDGAGNTTESSIYSIVPVDNDSPVISSVTGTTGTTGGNTLVTAAATDNIAPTAGQISFDGGVTWDDMIGSSSPFTYSVPIPSDSVASINYSVRVRDLAGNWSATEDRTITVTDNDKPVGSITINSGSTYTNSTSVTLDLSGASDNIGITEMRFRNGTSGSWSAWEAYAVSKSWTLPAGDGTKTVQAKFRDAALNVSHAASDTIILDTLIPVVTVDPLITNDSTPTISGTVDDDTANVSVNVDGNVYSAVVAGGVWTASVTDDLADGVYDIAATITDPANNSSSDSSTNELTVDLAGPDIPAAAPIAGNYPAPQLVALSSTDNHSLDANIAIYYTLDGSAPDNLSGTLYSSPIDIVSDALLKAIAYDEAGNASDILTAVYGIAPVISGQGSTSVTDVSATITWTTDQLSTSRVIYDTVSHGSLGSAPNYGYAFSSAEFDSVVKVTKHSVFITGLTPGTTYYFRAVSHGSPESVGSETSFATSAAPVITTAAATTVTETPVAPTLNRTPANAAAPAATNPDDQGKIKGDENTASTEEETGVNWTPWIILFILIILAGAATGGYFYWFAGDEEEDRDRSQNRAKQKTAPAPIKTAAKKPAAKAATKKPKRW